MTPLEYLLPIWSAYIVVTASPGPSNLAIMGAAMGHGRRPALALVGGILTGSMTWAMLAASGIVAVLSAYGHATMVIRVVGGAYLLYLAYRSAASALSKAGQLPVAPGSAAEKRYGVLYRRGLFLHLSNPKAILTWASIMSLGVAPGMPTFVFFIMLTGNLVLSILIFGGYAVLFASRPIAAVYRRSRRVFEGAAAVFFTYAGLRLMLARV